MATVELNDLETDLVADLLEREVADVREEIRGSEDPHYQDELREEEKLLVAILEKLRA